MLSTTSAGRRLGRKRMPQVSGARHVDVGGRNGALCMLIVLSLVGPIHVSAWMATTTSKAKATTNAYLKASPLQLEHGKTRHGCPLSLSPSMDQIMDQTETTPWTTRKTASAAAPSPQAVPVFLQRSFAHHSECDDMNQPPSLHMLNKHLELLATSSGSDIRGYFLSYPTRYPHQCSMAKMAHVVGQYMGAGIMQEQGGAPPLTPLAAYCFGYAFASSLLQDYPIHDDDVVGTSAPSDDSDWNSICIAIGRDPRRHGTILADAFARGAESASSRIIVCDAGLATTPACAAFCQTISRDLFLYGHRDTNDKNNNHYDRDHAHRVHAAVMVTASHLPASRNGFKFFTATSGGYTKIQLQALLPAASHCLATLYDAGGRLPPSCGVQQQQQDDAIVTISCRGGVTASTGGMAAYADALRNAIRQQVLSATTSAGVDSNQPLQGLKIVLNSGNGAGGFFAHVLSDLGANVNGSLHLPPNGDFANGVPNPENARMVTETAVACQAVQADLGILLDTDADRCGFVVPASFDEHGTITSYEPLNRNRLIALLSVILFPPNATATNSWIQGAVVTDSVTSEGLNTFLTQHLNLRHVRYRKGYANVIGKAKELNQVTSDRTAVDSRSGSSPLLHVKLAIETSGHAAMEENYFVDDGTYTAVKVVSWLATKRQQQQQQQQLLLPAQTAASPLLTAIAALQEMPLAEELRMPVKTQNLPDMRTVYDFCALLIEEACSCITIDSDESYDSAAAGVSLKSLSPFGWQLDTENLEGIRVRLNGSSNSSPTKQQQQEGSFFMLRCSLHDPLLSLQVEGVDRDQVRATMIDPLLELFRQQPVIANLLDLSALTQY